MHLPQRVTTKHSLRRLLGIVYSYITAIIISARMSDSKATNDTARPRNVVDVPESPDFPICYVMVKVLSTCVRVRREEVNPFQVRYRLTGTANLRQTPPNINSSLRKARSRALALTARALTLAKALISNFPSTYDVVGWKTHDG